MQTAFLQNNDKSRHVYKYLLPDSEESVAIEISENFKSIFP